MITKLKLNGHILLTREDENGNFWIQDCRENRAELGLPATGGNMIFGSCVVGPKGDERAAGEESISFFTVRGGATVEFLDSILEQHEINENVRRANAQKSFARMRRMNPVLPAGIAL